VCFKEAMSKEFKAYQEQVLDNARVMAKVMQERGFRIVSGRTDCHLFLVDLRAKNLTGRDAEAALGKANITVNKNSVPHDPQKPFITSGIRVGSPAMTTRGMEELEAEQIANFMCDVLEAHENEGVITRVREEVQKLCKKFPVYG
jgi:glycine hydroxymethyltransferase